MFTNKTAWFSDSCLDRARELWVQNGGKLEDVSLAQFVFSDDGNHEDTKELYNSDAYLKQHLAIFGSQYVVDAVQQGIDQVALGKYFLMPPYINNGRIQTAADLRNNSITPSSKDAKTKQSPKTNNRKRQQEEKCSDSSSSNLPSSSSNLEVSSVKEPQPVSRSLRSQEMRGAQVKTLLKTSTAPAHASATCARSSRKIGLVDIDSIPHVDSLPKVTSYLRTIYPGKYGLEVRHLT